MYEGPGLIIIISPGLFSYFLCTDIHLGTNTCMKQAISDPWELHYLKFVIEIRSRRL